MTTTTRARILDATLELVSESGLAQVALEEVGRRAGVSRQTVYRHFGNRRALLERMILREEQRLMARMDEAAALHHAVGPALEAAVATGLEALRAHPLLDHLLESEPGELLPFLATGRGPVQPAARAVLEDQLRRLAPDLERETALFVADTLTRMLMSYALHPPSETPAAVAKRLVPMLLHGVTD